MDVLAILTGAIGALIGAGIHYGFQRHSAFLAVRKEVVESHLLQLQNALESLYYRIDNVLDQGGRFVMEDDYFWRTTAFILGRVLAHEELLVSEGVYARLGYDPGLRRELKRGLHAINWTLDDQEHFLHYHRVQLAELGLDPDGPKSYSDFLVDLDAAAARPLAERIRRAVEALEPERLEALRDSARELIDLLEPRTGVPSALTLDRGP